jgi:hypothetical protein
VSRAQRERRPTGLTGAAGEYYVAAELSLRGRLATVTIKNAPGTDVLARHLVSGRVLSIQTKTASVGNKFTLGEKEERPAQGNNEWYILVALAALGLRPSFYLVPRNVVAAFLYADHRTWLAKKSPSGAAHKDTPRRAISRPTVDAYRERWDLLDLPTNEVPLLLDDAARRLVDEVGFAADHPGWPRPRP